MMTNRVFECVDCGHVGRSRRARPAAATGTRSPARSCGGMKKMKVAEDGSSTMCGGGQHVHGHGHGCCGGH
jgi:hypothetical protein